MNEATSARGNSQPAGNGVLGFSNVSDGCGVMGAHGRGGHGLFGQGGFGVTGVGGVMGVWGMAKGTGWVGYFSGPIRVEQTSWLTDADVSGAMKVGGDLAVQGSVSVQGDIIVCGDIQLPDKDIAERFEVESIANCLPGTVMVIGDTGALVPCSRRYDKRSVGVVGGAGSLRTAITLGASSDATPRVSIALVGTAFCRSTPIWHRSRQAT